MLLECIFRIYTYMEYVLKWFVCVRTYFYQVHFIQTLFGCMAHNTSAPNIIKHVGDGVWIEGGRIESGCVACVFLWFIVWNKMVYILDVNAGALSICFLTMANGGEFISSLIRDKGEGCNCGLN